MRLAFFALLLALVGCTYEPAEPTPAEMIEMSFPLAPWHLWGNQEQVKVAHPSSSASQFAQGRQLVKVNYARPETWRFLFGAQLLKAPAGVGVNNVDVIVDFDVMAGIGRSVLSMQGRPGEPGFARIVFHYSGSPASQLGVTKWTTQSQTPDLDNRTATPVILPISEFVAQDIQVSCRVTTQSASAADTETLVSVHAYVAPNVHIRPEWFTDGADNDRYRGLENGGT